MKHYQLPKRYKDFLNFLLEHDTSAYLQDLYIGDDCVGFSINLYSDIKYTKVHVDLSYQIKLVGDI